MYFPFFHILTFRFVLSSFSHSWCPTRLLSIAGDTDPCVYALSVCQVAAGVSLSAFSCAVQTCVIREVINRGRLNRTSLFCLAASVQRTNRASVRQGRISGARAKGAKGGCDGVPGQRRNVGGKRPRGDARCVRLTRSVVRAGPCLGTCRESSQWVINGRPFICPGLMCAWRSLVFSWTWHSHLGSLLDNMKSVVWGPTFD